jgi:hypothetical protein
MPPNWIHPLPSPDARPRWVFGLGAWVCRRCRIVLPDGVGADEPRCPVCHGPAEQTTIYNSGDRR